MPFCLAARLDTPTVRRTDEEIARRSQKVPRRMDGHREDPWLVTEETLGHSPARRRNTHLNSQVLPAVQHLLNEESAVRDIDPCDPQDCVDGYGLVPAMTHHDCQHFRGSAATAGSCEDRNDASKREQLLSGPSPTDAHTVIMSRSLDDGKIPRSSERRNRGSVS